MVAPAGEPSAAAADLNDVVDEYGPESFPASDPPSWWAGAADLHPRDRAAGEGAVAEGPVSGGHGVVG